MPDSVPSFIPALTPLQPSAFAEGAPGMPVVPGRPFRELLPVRDGPLTQVWRATGEDGAEAMVHVLREELHALVPDRARLLTQLGRGVGFTGSALHAPLWVDRLVDGRCAYATRWHDRVPAVDAARETLVSSAALADAATNFLSTLSELHRTGGVIGIIDPPSLAYLPALNSFFIDGAGVFHSLVAAGARRGDVARVAGTAAHLAPEILRDDAAVDVRADVYSAGTSLYELLTERAPFGGRTTAMMMASVLVEADVEGGAFVQALLRAIEREPDDRWSSADAFRAAIDGSLSSGHFVTPMGVSRTGAPSGRLDAVIAQRVAGAPPLTGWRAFLARLQGWR